MQKKIFSLLVLLMTAVSGAWATITVTWNNDDIPGTGDDTSFTKDGVTITAGSIDFEYKNFMQGGTFTTTLGNFTKIEVTANDFPQFSGTGWSGNSIKQTWTGNASSVSFSGNIMGMVPIGGNINFVFTIEPATATNYYLVGTMNDWGASKQFLLTPNPGNAAEYMITLNLKADTQLKVIGVEEGKETVWYPSGDNYVVNDAGQYTVYFRPDGQGGEGWHQGCIYLEKAPDPAIPVTEVENAKNEWQFQMPDYAVVAKIEYDTELELREENTNTSVLAEWDGYEADVTLKRTLQNGGWNTLAVPFNVSSTALTALNAILAQQGGSLTVKKLANTTLSGETIFLNFEDAHEIVAGNPYLVKVTKDVNLATLPAALATLGAAVNPFHDAEISKDPVPVETYYADFIPTLGKTTIENVAADNVLFVAAENKLKNPDQMPAYMKGFRAYFLLKNLPAAARAFALNIDGEITGIDATLVNSEKVNSDVYDLQGRKVNAAQKGVYIVNGKKVIK